MNTPIFSGLNTEKEAAFRAGGGGQQKTVTPETDCRVDPGVNTGQKDVELHTLNQSCFPGLTLTAGPWWRRGTGVWSYNYFKMIGLVKPGGAGCNPSGRRDWDRIACSSLPGSWGEFQAHLSKLLETLSQVLRLQKDLVLPQHAGGQVCPSCDGLSEQCPLPQAQIFELLAYHWWNYLRSWCALAGGNTSLGWALRAHSLTSHPVHALRFKLACRWKWSLLPVPAPSTGPSIVMDSYPSGAIHPNIPSLP